MGNMVRGMSSSGLLGVVPRLLSGNSSRRARNQAAAAAQQAAVQTQVSNVNQQNAVTEQASASSRALGGVTRNRRGMRLFSSQEGRSTLG